LGEFELNTRAGELRGQGRITRVQDRPLQLLLLLLEHPNELVTREQIRERIWGPSKFHDFEDSLNQAVRKLREAFGDSASEPTVIETIPRRGYRLIAPVSTSGKNRVSSSRAVSVPGHATVGRQRELDLLQASLAEAAEGHGRIVCICGEPGIGKTTLAETFIATLSNFDLCRVAIGRCSERFAGAEAYLPVVEALESLLRTPESGAVAARCLSTAAPSWYAGMPTELTASGPPLDTNLPEAHAATQERRKREFVRFLEAVTADRPLLLFIEDLHWADPSSVDLLAYALPRCAALRVLVVGTYRPSELVRTDHAFLEVKRELQAHRLCREIELSTLGREDVDNLIELEFPNNGFSKDFSAALYSRTEGYPLFLVDLLQNLKSAGLISFEDGRWVLTRGLEIENLPDSVRAMVDRQIGRLSAAERAVLEVASVEGYRFHSSVVAEVLGKSSSEVEDTLDTLQVKHGLVRYLTDQALGGSSVTSRYSFSHALYLNAVHGGLRAARRAAVSKAVAEALLTRYTGSESEIASQLGQLFETAGDWQRAASFFTIAAGNAGKLSAYREAESLFGRAIGMARMLDGPARDRQLLDTTLQLARTRQALSHFEKSIEQYEAAEKLAAALGDVEAQVEAICGAAFSAGYLKRTDEMRDRAVHAIEVATAAGSSAAYPESVLGFQQIFVGDLAGARENHERALAVLKRTPSTPGVFAAVSYGFLNDLQSEYQQADAVLVDAIQQIRITGSWSDLLRASWFHGMVQANLGRIGEALQTLTKAMQLAELNGETYWYSRFPNTIGWIYGEMSDFESAVRLNTEGVRAGKEAGTLEAEANAHINLAAAYVGLGELARAKDHLSAGESILNQESQKHWLRWRFRIRFELAEANYLIAAGDTAKARAAAESALHRATGVLARKHAATAQRMLGDIAAVEERFDDAASHYDAGLAVLRRHPCPIIEWRLLRAAGELASRGESHTLSDQFLLRSRDSAKALADSIHDAALRNTFLRAEPAVLRAGYAAYSRAW
jgi:DNA-binding winged helix-turn-helix (wHTH) protein/tetratricopeptide (TPR) repeat protein